MKNINTLIIAVLMLALFQSCSTTRPEGQTEAEVLYKEAQLLMDDGHYTMAIEKLNGIRSQYPYSVYSTQAELLQADIFFKQENYVEAAAAYILFKDFHPKHDKIPYVLTQIAKSFFLQVPSTVDRDLTPAFQAIKYYEEVVNRYADSEYAKEAADRIVKCREMIEAKEKYIADFYFKTKVYDAARFRYISILESFKSPKLISHSLMRALQSSVNLKEYKTCVATGDKYRSMVSGSGQTSVDKIIQNCKMKIQATTGDAT